MSNPASDEEEPNPKELERIRKFHSNPCWLAYIHHYVFIIPDNEEPWEVKLEEINQVSYNHGKLIRIVTSFDCGVDQLKGLVSYDGTFALPCAGIFKEKKNAIDYFNRLFLMLNLNGFYVEYVDHRDVLGGQLHEKWGITNWEFGNSASSVLHSKNRNRLSSSFDTIVLSNPRHLHVSELHSLLTKGKLILSKIPNLSAKFLNIGITEIRYQNWDLVLSNLWISAEQLIDHLWHNVFLKLESKHPANEISGRKTSFKDDSRTWSAVVKQELLFQMEIISEDILTHLFNARKIRNKLVHEGKTVDKEIAIGLFHAVRDLLMIASGQKITLFKDIDDDERNPIYKTKNVDLFEDWRTTFTDKKPQ